MADTILVKSARPDNRVAFYERHPAHPTGEVYVAGQTRNKLDGGSVVTDKQGNPVQEPNVVEVAPTSAVLAAISNKQLIEVNAEGESESGEEPQPALTDVKGIGPSRAAALEEMGITTVEELANSDNEEVPEELKEAAKELLAD